MARKKAVDDKPRWFRAICPCCDKEDMPEIKPMIYLCDVCNCEYSVIEIWKKILEK